jgi:hypothetical protein
MATCACILMTTWEILSHTRAGQVLPSNTCRLDTLYHCNCSVCLLCERAVVRSGNLLVVSFAKFFFGLQYSAACVGLDCGLEVGSIEDLADFEFALTEWCALE